MKINLRGIEKGTIIRGLTLGLAMINAGLKLFGIDVLPIEDADINTGVTFVWLAASSIAGWYKNNSVTIQAQTADKVMIKLKEAVKTKLESEINEEIEKMLGGK